MMCPKFNSECIGRNCMAFEPTWQRMCKCSVCDKNIHIQTPRNRNDTCGDTGKPHKLAKADTFSAGMCLEYGGDIVWVKAYT